MLHDRPHHLAQRWITYRGRLAAGDLFLGPYPGSILAKLQMPKERSLDWDRRAVRKRLGAIVHAVFG
jgi:hypothetical protein